MSCPPLCEENTNPVLASPQEIDIREFDWSVHLTFKTRFGSKNHYPSTMWCLCCKEEKRKLSSLLVLARVLLVKEIIQEQYHLFCSMCCKWVHASCKTRGASILLACDMADNSSNEQDDSEERVFAAERIEKRRIRKVSLIYSLIYIMGLRVQ